MLNDVIEALVGPRLFDRINIPRRGKNTEGVGISVAFVAEEALTLVGEASTDLAGWDFLPNRRENLS